MPATRQSEHVTLTSVLPLNGVDLGEYAGQLSTQDYAPVTTLAGVEFLELRQSVDEGGDFMELARLGPNGELLAKPEVHVSQVNFSRVLPGAIKAFHLHFNQEDVWFVPPEDRLLVGLLDTRRDSPTYRGHMRFVLGAGRCRLLYIPRGVAHGVANLWPQPAALMYLVNQHFSVDEPDERRLPWDIQGVDFWTIRPG